jgi:hypothetical protein
MVESKVWSRFNRELSDEFLLERVENPICPGFPDVFIQHKTTRIAGLVELKSRDTKHWVSRNQAMLLRRYRAAGVRVMIITGAANDDFHYWPVGKDYPWIEEILIKVAPHQTLHSLDSQFATLFLNL